MSDDTSLFDPATFFQTDLNESFDTSRPPIPPGEYPADIDKIDLRSGISAKGNKWAALDVTWAIDDEFVRQETGLSKPTARQTLFLDLREDGEGLATGKGKNVALGILRAAVNQNDASTPWNFNMLVGARALARTGLREYNGRQFNEVTAVMAI